MKLGDIVLIWGASRRPRLLRHPDGARRRRHADLRRVPPEKAEICRAMGAELVIDRTAEGYRFWNDESTAQDPQASGSGSARRSAS